MDGTKRGTIAWQPLGGLCNVRHPDQLHSEPAGHAGQPWVVVSLALVWSSKNVFNHNIPYCWTCFRMVDDFNLYFTILNPLKPFGDEWGGLCVGPPRWKYYTQVFFWVQHVQTMLKENTADVCIDLLRSIDHILLMYKNDWIYWFLSARKLHRLS